MKRRTIKSPMDLLLSYQRRWVDDAARFKIGMMARQTGKSFGTAGEAVRDSFQKKDNWVILSAGERQALEWMRKAKEWAEAFSLSLSGYQETRDHAEAVLKSAEIEWSNGSRMLALPANPNTARGYSANLVLDEFAFHENPDAIWRGIYPSISNPLRGQWKIRIVSTPNGRANKFYDLWTKNDKYSKHLVDIYQAVKEGLPLDVNDLREGLDDPDGWAQEYECQFIDNSSVLLPYDLIATCESDEATEQEPEQDGQSAIHGPVYLGVDIGRKKDLTVCWMMEQVGGLLWTREVLVLEKVPFHIQQDLIGSRVRRAIRTCIDSTGIGAMLAEELRRIHGPRVEECNFTPAFKSDIFLNLRRSFEDKTLRVPVSRVIREDLHTLQKITTTSGNVRFAAGHTEDGHADRAAALALAVHAAADMGVQYRRPIVVSRGPASKARRKRSIVG